MLISKILKYKGAIKNTSIYFFTSVFCSLISLVVSPFLALHLSPEDFAIVGYYTSFNTLFLFTLNFSFITYYVKNYMSFSDEERQKTLNTILIGLIFIGILGSILLYLSFNLYYNLANVKIDFSPYFYLFLITIAFNNSFLLLQAECRMKRNATKFCIYSVINAILLQTSSLFFINYCKWGAFGKMLAPAIVSIIFSIYSYKKLLKGYSFDFAIFKKMLSFCWPLVLSAYLWYLFSNLDRPLLESLHDIRTLGLYNIGVTISGVFMMFYTAIYSTFEPDIYNCITIKNYRRLIVIFLVIILTNAIPSLVFIPFSKFFVGLLTYGKYTEASTYCSILVLKNITMSFYYIIVAVIIGLGYTKVDLYLRIVGVLICVPMLIYLIDNYGFYGAAWGQVISFLVMFVLSASFLMFIKKSTN